MKFLDYLQQNVVFLDGSMGTLLQSRGLKAGECPERWNITRKEDIIAVHREYFEAGSNVVCTNTFGANALKFGEDELKEIIFAAVQNAKTAREVAEAPQEKFVALDVGPLGKLLKPLGDLDFEDAVKIFKRTVSLGVKADVDLILIETMTDLYETKAALLAVKEECDLPVIVSNAYEKDCATMTGSTPECAVALLEGMGADVVGTNCSLGARQLLAVAKRLVDRSSVPVAFKPNAGLPKVENGKTVFEANAEEFSDAVADAVKLGVRLVGGCCGTTPEYIAKTVAKCKGLPVIPVEDKGKTVVSSYCKTVEFGDKPILIGERINPTGKKRFKEALKQKDFGYILNEGVTQEAKGARVLDVNVGSPEVDEEKMLVQTVKKLQGVVKTPLQIDTSNVVAMEKALRVYNGKPLINSVNGKKESMKEVFPLVKKYGGVVVALTLDENGIPSTAGGRVEIAKKILKAAEDYGISKKDIIFDTLTMTVSADKTAALATLESLKMIREELGCHTVLGVSNVSFGLPNRDILNGAFFGMALNCGLSGAILNVNSAEMMKTYHAFNALTGKDENFEEYINNADKLAITPTQAATTANAEVKSGIEGLSPLKYAIVKGFKESAEGLTEELIKERDGLEIVNGEIIPALNMVGEGFEKKTVFLPQLLLSAESAKAAFEVIKKRSNAEKSEKGAKVILATVRGDIHDIGKNIVKLLLENYGFDVIDLGKDVNEEVIVNAAIAENAKIVGLSALMTTTVPYMESTIRLLKEKAPEIKTIVGGAVLTEEYAKKINADFYAKDGMETVRVAQALS